MKRREHRFWLVMEVMAYLFLGAMVLTALGLIMHWVGVLPLPGV